MKKYLNQRLAEALAERKYTQAYAIAVVMFGPLAENNDNADSDVSKTTIAKVRTISLILHEIRQALIEILETKINEVARKEKIIKEISDLQKFIEEISNIQDNYHHYDWKKLLFIKDKTPAQNAIKFLENFSLKYMRHCLQEREKVILTLIKLTDEVCENQA